MKLVPALGYLALLVPSLWAAAVVWERVAVDKLFYCWDSVGIPGDFIPPFVHDATREKLTDREYLLAARRAGGPVKDYYFVAPASVYGLWVLHVLTAFLLPALPFTLVGRGTRRS